MGDSRIENILENMLGADNVIEEPQSRNEALLIEILNSGGGGGGGGGTAGVTTWNGRRGVVRPQAGDYTAAQVNTSATGKTVQNRIDELAAEDATLHQDIADLEAALTPDANFSPTSNKAVRNSTVTAAIESLRDQAVPTGGDPDDLLMKASAVDGDAVWRPSSGFMLKSVYDPADNGKVDSADAADAVQGPIYKATLPNKGRDASLITDADVGVANGVVPLDNNRKILPEFMPDNIASGLTYGGIFNATTRVVRLTPQAKSILGVSSDTMTLQNSSTVPEGYPANISLFYITTTPGTFATMDFANGDWLISLGTEWRQLASGNQVSSVNSKTGAVELNSDEVSQGTTNLYMTPAERTKLANVEAEATKDTDYIRSAAVTTLVDDTKRLRLTTKRGSIIDFTSTATDLTDYLKKNGDATNTYATYTESVTRPTFNNNETAGVFHGKVVTWLKALKDVAFTGRYTDLTDKPTYNGATIDGAMSAADLGTLDVQQVTELPVSPKGNTMYVLNTTEGGQPITKFYVYTDSMKEMSGALTAYYVQTSPEDTPPTNNGLYIYQWTPTGATEQTTVTGIKTADGWFRFGVTKYGELEGKPSIDGATIEAGDQTHESLGLVGEGDFVQAATGKADGIEVVLPAGTPSSPIVLSEIDDTDAMKYSTVHTSSNHYLNARFDALNDALAGKLNMLFVNALPSEPERNTQYYVSTATEGVWHIWIVDSVGTVRDGGTTEIDLDGLVRDTRTIAGIPLDADVTAAQLAEATKDEAVAMTGKTIDAESNTVSNIATANLKSGVLQTSMPSAPTDTQLVSAKLVDSLTKPSVLTGAGALTLQRTNPVTASSFNSYATTQLIKVGKLCIFTSHLTFTKNSSSNMWIVLGTIPSGYRPKRNTVFTGSLWNTAETTGIGGHITTGGELRWWCDGNGAAAITSGQLRFMSIYECED